MQQNTLSSLESPFRSTPKSRISSSKSNSALKSDSCHKRRIISRNSGEGGAWPLERAVYPKRWVKCPPKSPVCALKRWKATSHSLRLQLLLSPFIKFWVTFGNNHQFAITQNCPTLFVFRCLLTDDYIVHMHKCWKNAFNILLSSHMLRRRCETYLEKHRFVPYVLKQLWSLAA